MTRWQLRPARIVAIATSVLAHAVLLWAILHIVLGNTGPPPPVPVTLIREPPPLRLPPKPVPPKPVPPPPRPIPRPMPVPRPAAPSPRPIPKPVPHAPPHPITHARPNLLAQRRAPIPRPTTRATRAGPPVMHFGSAGAEAGLGLDLGAPSGGGGGATGASHGSIDGFAESVKRRIQSMKTYPPGLPYLPMECIVEYRVTVDARGNMIDYRITGCGNPFLDSATRAAILKAAPFARPPDFGGTRYDVYGTLIYLKH